MKLRRSGLLLCSLSLFGMLSSHTQPAILNQRQYAAQIVPTQPSFSYKFLWEDKDGNTYPLVGAKVEWSYKQLGFTYTTYTDEFGYITINFINQAWKSRFTLNKLSLENDNISIEHFDNNIIGSPSSVYTLDISSFNNSSTIVINPDGSDSYSEDFGKATHIFESLYYYSQYTRSILPEGEKLERCTAYYPCQSKYNKEKKSYDAVTNAYYSNNGIYLPAENFNNNLGVYESWDTIGHEYGHHLGGTLNILPALYSGSHDSNLDDIDQCIINDKVNYDELTKEDLYTYTERGLGLAWSEAWPTYWANEAQKTFPKQLIDNYALRDIAYHIDEFITIDQNTGVITYPRTSKTSLANDKYEAFNLSSIDYYSLKHPYIEHNKFSNITYYQSLGYGGPCVCGESCERSIMGFLSNLNDTISQQSFEADHIWKMMFDMRNYYNTNYNGYAVTNFSLFYNFLINNLDKFKNIIGTDNFIYSLDIDENTLSLLLEKSQISAQNIGAELSNGNVILTWILNGNYENLSYPCKASLNISNKNQIKVIELSPKLIFASKNNATFSASIPAEALLSIFSEYNETGDFSDIKTISLSVNPHTYLYYTRSKTVIDNSGPYTTTLYADTYLSLNLMIAIISHRTNIG